MSESNGKLHLTESAWISDGYVFSGFVSRVPRLHPAVHFTFRQCTPEQRSTIFGRIRGSNDVEAERVSAAVIAKQVIAWDLKRAGKDGKPEDVPIDAASAGRIQPVLKTKLFEIVTGGMPSDPDPDRPEDDPSDYGAQLEAALAGEPATQQDIDAKN